MICGSMRRAHAPVRPELFLKFKCNAQIHLMLYRVHMNTMLVKTLHLFVFICFVLSISCVSWSTLTAEQLRALPIEEFASITSDQLASIPAQAFSGFSRSQFSAVPTTAVSGLKDVQMTNLPADACAGFNADQFSQLSVSAISAYTDDCFDAMPGTVFAQISAEQLSAFTSEICRLFWPGLLSTVPPASFAGLRPNCGARIRADSLYLLTADGLSNISPDVFAVFSSNQLSWFNGMSYAGISADQLRMINTSCTGLESRHVTPMPPAAAVGLTAGCVQNFGFSAISGLSGAFLANMPSESFGAFRAVQIGSFTPSTLEFIRADQFAALNPDACAGFVSEQTALFPVTAAHGITASCFSQFQSLGLACMGLSPEFIEAMDPSAGAGLTIDCMMFIDTAATCNAFTPQFFVNIPADTFGAMSSECVGLLRPEAINAMTPQQIRSLAPESFSGFTTTIRYLSDATLMATTVEQLGNLSTGLGGMTGEQLILVLNKYQVDLVNRWTEAQLLLTDFGLVESIYNTVPLMVDWFNINVKTVTWLQIALLKTDPAPKFTAKFISQMPDYAVAGFRQDQARALSLEAVAAFTSDQAEQFSREFVEAFNGKQVAALAPATFRNMSSHGIAGLRPEVIPFITASQLQYLTELQLTVLKCDQLHAFTETQLSQMELHMLSMFQEKMEADCSDSGTTPQSGNEEGKTPNNDESYFPTPKVILIVFVIITGLAIIIGVVVFFVQRRNHRAANIDLRREPLL